MSDDKEKTWHGIPARQKAPSYMSFEVTSEQQEDIKPFLESVKGLVHAAGLVLVSATPVG